MSGKTLILNKGQHLFKQGDASNGMFLVRKGTLRVYLEKDGHKVELAMVTAGGMIGEMALFDQKPRSASVEATESTEVTHITSQDFAKLMQQIPKWFTALMSTLSGRLRATNERLEKLQAQSTPAMLGMKSVLRILWVIDMLLNTEGEKSGKEWLVEKETTVQTLVLHFAEETGLIDKLLGILDTEGVIKLKKNSYNKDAIATPNKGSLTRFVTFLSDYLKQAATASLSQAAVDILKALKNFGDEQAYDNFGVKLSDLQMVGQKMRLGTLTEWPQDVMSLKSIHLDLSVVKAADGSVTLKTQKKVLKEVVTNHSCLLVLNQKLFSSS